MTPIRSISGSTPATSSTSRRRLRARTQSSSWPILAPRRSFRTVTPRVPSTFSCRCGFDPPGHAGSRRGFPAAAKHDNRARMTAARIRRLAVQNFRSYRGAGLSTDADVLVLLGANGAGKTNLLEAISFLTPGRGLRRATLEEVAFQEGGGSWAVSAEIEGAVGIATLGTGIEPTSGDERVSTRKCRIDREPVNSAAAFADHLRIVWLTPAMDGLFSGPASERRRFLDRMVLTIDAEHASRVSALERSLRSRNRLLEDTRPDPHWLDAVEHETAEMAVAVAAGRSETMRRLQSVVLNRRDPDSPFPWAEISIE